MKIEKIHKGNPKPNLSYLLNLIAKIIPFALGFVLLFGLSLNISLTRNGGFLSYGQLLNNSTTLLLAKNFATLLKIVTISVTSLCASYLLIYNYQKNITKSKIYLLWYIAYLVYISGSLVWYLLWPLNDSNALLQIQILAGMPLLLLLINVSFEIYNYYFLSKTNPRGVSFTYLFYFSNIAKIVLLAVYGASIILFSLVDEFPKLFTTENLPFSITNSKNVIYLIFAVVALVAFLGSLITVYNYFSTKKDNLFFRTFAKFGLSLIPSAVVFATLQSVILSFQATLLFGTKTQDIIAFSIMSALVVISISLFSALAFNKKMKHFRLTFVDFSFFFLAALLSLVAYIVGLNNSDAYHKFIVVIIYSFGILALGIIRFWKYKLSSLLSLVIYGSMFVFVTLTTVLAYIDVQSNLLANQFISSVLVVVSITDLLLICSIIINFTYFVYVVVQILISSFIVLKANRQAQANRKEQHETI
ncbi:MSC_0624 family F1-like ATPase-associated membrane protein [Mycoplasma corogypsi]|uniref:MSC_0624 family F1-like ATPase-associated membrane protein n=1 Tax=Mycoplasma corogypsi TaxID=2106 RepID=UPI003873BB95